MTGPAIRSRLHALQADLGAARTGRDLLDNTREALLRALSERAHQLAAARRAAREAWAEAERALRAACIDIGADGVDAAALAQPISAAVDWRNGSVMGVPTPRLDVRMAGFAPRYGAAATTALVDRAGARFAALLPALVRLAEEEEAVRNLEAALRRTVRRMRALEQVVIPGLAREAQEVAAALEEEERDDVIRARRWLATRERSSPPAAAGVSWRG
jgi:V/A-type H+-transporting ATPase subunit D